MTDVWDLVSYHSAECRDGNRAVDEKYTFELKTDQFSAAVFI
jgi:hypothetical protein